MKALHDKTNKLDKKTLAIKKTDKEFQERTIDAVSDDGDGWDICIDRNGHLFVKKVDGFEPKNGMIMRTYGKGFGYSVRGVDIDNVTHFYRTPEQAEQDHKDWCENHKKEQKERYEKAKNQLEEDYKSLPPEYQKRIDRLRKKDPDTRYEWESYEMFILKQSAIIASKFKTEEEVAEWSKSSWDEQVKKVPELDEGHSGNTFGCAVQFAKRYLKGYEL